jgi:hypothetical protein
MSAKWTEGPWLIDPNNEACIVGSAVDLNAHGDPAYPEVCELSHSYHEQANARLIAAAPDLAEAAKAVLKWADDLKPYAEDGSVLVPVFEALRAALAKAGAT